MLDASIARFSCVGGVTITERQFDDDEEYNPLKKLQLSSTERKGMSGLLQKDPSLGGSTSEYSNWHNDDEKEKGKQKVMVDFSSLKVLDHSRVGLTFSRAERRRRNRL